MLRPVVGMSTGSSISVVEFVVQPDLFSNSSLTLVGAPLTTDDDVVSSHICHMCYAYTIIYCIHIIMVYYGGIIIDRFLFIIIKLFYDDVLYIFYYYYYTHTQFGVPKQ